jgi:hypothetical protein
MKSISRDVNSIHFLRRNILKQQKKLSMFPTFYIINLKNAKKAQAILQSSVHINFKNAKKAQAILQSSVHINFKNAKKAQAILQSSVHINFKNAKKVKTIVQSLAQQFNIFSTLSCYKLPLLTVRHIFLVAGKTLEESYLVALH